MATLSRQPFAPLDHTRLKTLTSLKNRQNALSSPPVKRKASEVVDADDFENVDPVLFSKRAKGASTDGVEFTKPFFKPPVFVLAKTASASNLHSVAGLPPSKLSCSSKPRTFLQPKSPASRLSAITASSPLTAPAGRSPTRGSKRIGILSKRRHTQRIDPPSFGLGAGSSVPFSLDAALKGSIPAYSGSLRTSSVPVAAAAPVSSDSFLLSTGGMQSSWFFDIHEDTPEQEMTNLLQHGTCTLDISSDEESERRQSRDRAEGRDKENIPPADDVSQTSARQAARVGDVDDMIIEKQRGPLAEMNAADYYAEGCTEDSVVLVPWDEEEAGTVVGDNDQHQHQHQHHTLPGKDEQPPCDGEQGQQRVTLAHVESVNVDDIMSNNDGPSLQAAVLEPMEGTGESFELWESTSAKDEGDAPASPLPMAEEGHENRVVEVERVV
ncbi:hypothetical protein QBC41DRAFT_129076 [Cercophora samala]|uniref:Thymidylate kinase n=1 Tax=Cercophora samala TaxID=330535 RepID=A0AA40DBZ0_9PEZI|nr:hypothetical protein QBC41DRAFT_129076 [Cercophora samala]